MGRRSVTTNRFKIILIAEDEELIRAMLCDYLTEAGYEVFAASDAAHARELIASHPDIDLVLTDVNMPGDMDGRMLADWLSTQRPGLPVILTSGLVHVASNSAQPRRFIAKPFMLEDLGRAIQELLH